MARSGLKTSRHRSRLPRRAAQRPAVRWDEPARARRGSRKRACQTRTRSPDFEATCETTAPPRQLSPRLKPAGAHRSDDTAVDQQITAGDERAIGTHQVRGCRANLIWGAATACGGDLHHLLIARPTGRVELVHRQWSEDDAGADRVDPGTPVAPLHGGGLY